MIQWMKRFWDCNGSKDLMYDAAGRRKNIEPDFSFATKVVVPKVYNG